MNKTDKFLNQDQKGFSYNQYKLIKKLGEGSFGFTYLVQIGSEYYAMKFEDKSKNKHLLENEAHIMNYLRGPKIPYIRSLGHIIQEGTDYDVLIMELMGDSLDKIFEKMHKKMSIRCVCNIAIQLIDTLKFIHDKHVIHRDIKPDNLTIGFGSKKKYIFILDFGLSRKYRDPNTLEHYTLEQRRRLIGTARYASLNALRGITQSRRDDLESVGYILMYFLRGNLPWQGIYATKVTKEEKHAAVLEKKVQTSIEELCRGFPKEFGEYLKYVRGLGYESEPDYDYLRGLFMGVLRKIGVGFDYFYDWDSDTSGIECFKNTQNSTYNNGYSEENKENNRERDACCIII